MLRPATVAFVESWWAAVFGVERATLWRETTVAPDAQAGWFAAWRAGVVHVLAQHGQWPDDLDPQPGEQFWNRFVTERGLRLLGPSVHAYLDVEPETGRGLSRIVGGHAAATAAREAGLARWRATHTNQGSLRSGAVLGFIPWCEQVFVH